MSSINVINSKNNTSIMLIHNITNSQKKYLESIDQKYIIGGMIPDISIEKIYKANYDDNVEADNRLISPFNIETNDTDNINALCYIL